MRGLTRDWLADDFERLRNDLSRLVSPIRDVGVAADSFQVILSIDDEDELSGPISAPDWLSSPPYRLTGRISSSGLADLELVLPKGRPKPIHERFVASEGRLPTCGPFELDFRVWDRDSLGSLAARKESTIKDVRRMLDEVAGVNVYRDGFRVLPYGEHGDDWLGLDRLRIQNPTLRISNNQIVGFVFISADQNPNLVDQTNREGLVQGDAFEDIVALCRAALVEIEAPRYRLRRPTRERVGTSLFDGFSLEPISDLVRKNHPRDQELRRAIDRTSSAMDEGIGKVREILSRYLRLATLGQLIDGVIHNGSQPVAAIVNEVDEAADDLGRLSTVATMTRTTRRHLSVIGKQAAVLSSVLNRIAPFGGRRRGRPRSIVLQEEIRDGVAILADEAAAESVRITLPRGRLEITADPTEIQEIVYNLVSNSLYWLRQVPAAKRRIKISVSRTSEGEVEMLFSDSGPGVKRSDRDRIFDPYYSTKPQGTGLGLSLVGDIVGEYYGGELQLVESDELGGALFRVLLRRRVK
jgi:signal transduction histidine kinase